MTGCKIFIIDDDEDFKKVLTMRLKSFMPETDFTMVQNLASARSYLKENDPSVFDLVILDEHLPDGRGSDFLSEGWFESLAVLSVSSDTADELPGAAVGAGARYFLNKVQVKEALFQHLVRGIIDRNKLSRELNHVRDNELRIDTVRTLVGTLRHEINNPLGAVLGAAYILRNTPSASKEQIEASELVETSGKRIKHVLDELCQAIELDQVTKANQKVFHIPGDQPWESGSDPKKKK